MHFKRTFACVALAMLGLSLMIRDASAALIAYDSAGDSAYNSGTVVGVNGGYGWGGPWSVPADNNGGPPLLGSSSLIGGAGSGTGYINSPKAPDGRAWVIGTGVVQTPIPTAIRPFSGPLMPGQTFSIDFDANPGASALINLGSLYVGVGANINSVPRYFAQSVVDIDHGLVGYDGPPATDFGARADFTVLTDSTAQVTITSLAPGGESDSFILPNSTPMTEMVAQQESFPGYLYFNNISITPEPGGIALAIVALAVISFGRRGRRDARLSSDV